MLFVFLLSGQVFAFDIMGIKPGMTFDAAQKLVNFKYKNDTVWRNSMIHHTGYSQSGVYATTISVVVGDDNIIYLVRLSLQCNDSERSDICISKVEELYNATIEKFGQPEEVKKIPPLFIATGSYWNISSEQHENICKPGFDTMNSNFASFSNSLNQGDVSAFHKNLCKYYRSYSDYDQEVMGR